MIDFKTIGAAVTGIAAVVGFLYREYTNKHKAIDDHNDKQDLAIDSVEDRTLVLETKMEAAEPAVAQIRSQQQLDGIRLATTEAAVNQIRGDVTEIKQAMSMKLDRIPELTEALRNFENLCKTFIPRGEAEARFEAAEQRMDGMASSVRDAYRLDKK